MKELPNIELALDRGCKFVVQDTTKVVKSKKNGSEPIQLAEGANPPPAVLPSRTTEAAPEGERRSRGTFFSTQQKKAVDRKKKEAAEAASPNRRKVLRNQTFWRTFGGTTVTGFLLRSPSMVVARPE
jgi:hypothetical protein